MRGYTRSNWIAQRLQMGTWTYVSNLLNEPPETQPQAQEVLPLRQSWHVLVLIGPEGDGRYFYATCFRGELWNGSG